MAPFQRILEGVVLCRRGPPSRDSASPWPPKCPGGCSPHGTPEWAFVSPLAGQQRESPTSLASLGIQSERGQQAGGDEAGMGRAELLSKTHKLVPERNGASILPISSLPQPLPGKQHEGLGWSKTQAWVWGMALGKPGLPFRRTQRLQGPVWAQPPQGSGLELGTLDPREPQVNRRAQTHVAQEKGKVLHG